ncbi:MAG: hypothetical protein AAFZ63_21785 [Bacteroidota bacterium]
MNNYRFFSNPELRFILRGWAGVSQRSIEDIQEYCQRNRINTTRWTESEEMWQVELSIPRLAQEQAENTLSVYKLRAAKRADQFGLIFFIGALALLFCIAIYTYINGSPDNLGPVGTLTTCCFLFFLGRQLYIQLKRARAENDIDKRIIITDTQLSFQKDGRIRLTGEIAKIKFYWQEGFDASSQPDITLDLVLKNQETIRIDKDSCRKELFLLADTLQEQTGIKMQVMLKSPPLSYTQAL